MQIGKYIQMHAEKKSKAVWWWHFNGVIQEEYTYIYIKSYSKENFDFHIGNC